MLFRLELNNLDDPPVHYVVYRETINQSPTTLCASEHRPWLIEFLPVNRIPPRYAVDE